MAVKATILKLLSSVGTIEVDLPVKYYLYRSAVYAPFFGELSAGIQRIHTVGTPWFSLNGRSTANLSVECAGKDEGAPKTGSGGGTEKPSCSRGKTRCHKKRKKKKRRSKGEKKAGEVETPEEKKEQGDPCNAKKSICLDVKAAVEESKTKAAADKNEPCSFTLPKVAEPVPPVPCEIQPKKIVRKCEVKVKECWNDNDELEKKGRKKDLMKAPEPRDPCKDGPKPEVKVPCVCAPPPKVEEYDYSGQTKEIPSPHIFKRMPPGSLSPGVGSNGVYKNPEYFSYNKWSYYEAAVGIARNSCPQPSNKNKQPTGKPKPSS